MRLENTDLVPTVVWLTGRPCAGKSTVALLVADSVRAHGRSARILDGDELRRTVSAGLGFSAEVYVDAPVSVCAARDLKGMYARARQGALREFTGVSSPYEPPDAPDLHLDTVVEEPTESAHRVMTMLKARGAL
ncbi:MAG: adenylyl-sulfate kinase [Actinobacteria bacterium]|nr:MAG: adenylyl-sulfate kinase [Actinomycetota bacterium]